MRKPLAAVLALTSVAWSQTTMTTIPVATGLSKPIALAAPDDPARLFVVEQTGKIRVIRDGVLLAAPFLDLTGIAAQAIGEQGVFGLVFHPAYASNGRFFVWYTRVGDQSGVLAEYAVSANPDVALTQGRVVLVVPPTSGDHQGGCLQFGLDGKLFIATGDGGSSTPGDPECDGQNGQSLFGKLLRIDVDGALPYAIPPDNPFVGNPAFRPEIWAWGLRHAWRFSIDPANGDLYVGDVGQASREEIDYLPSGAGGLNFGWNAMEGSLCTNYAACAGAPACAAPSLKLPVWEYDHSGGRCAVIGGHVYRGCRIPSSWGRYFFADFCGRKIYTIEVVGGVATNFTDRTAELAPSTGGPIFQIVSFGVDANGEVYIVDRVGTIFQVVPVDDCSISTFGSSNPNSTGAAAHIGSLGTASVCAGDLVITGAGLPPSTNCLAFFSSVQLPNCLPFGNGTMCVGAPRRRLAPVAASAAGTVAIPFGAALTGQFGITESDTRFFQLWFRDPTAGGSMTNTSDGLEVVFCH